MKNRWVTTRDPNGVWTIDFPKIVGKQDFPKLIDYMAEFLAIAEEEKVFTVKQSRMGTIGAPNLPYLEQVKWSAEERGILPFFSYINGAWERDGFVAETPAQLAYYNKDGLVVEEEVSNLGSLLQTLNGWEDGDRWHDEIYFYAEPFPPILILGSERLSTHPYDRPSFDIWLNTDIWFPQVIDFVKYLGMPFGYKADIVENRELANIHTPRLNRFLTAIHKLSLSYGATWTLSRPDYLHLYQELLMETGIKLGS